MNEMQTGLIAKVNLKGANALDSFIFVFAHSPTLATQLTGILEQSLVKLSRYDEGTFFAPILSITVSVHGQIRRHFHL